MNGSAKNNEKYRRILDAAIKVFAQNGFFNSKVAQIAKQANVADGTIYLYFKNKDDILISLFEDKMNEIIAGLNERLEGVVDPFEKIRIYIRSHFEMIRDYHDLAEVITVELRQSTKFMKQYHNKQFTRYLKVLADIIRDGQQSGLFAGEISPTILSRALFGMMDELSLFMVLSTAKKQPDIGKIAGEIGDFFIRGLAVGGQSAEATDRT